MKQIVGSKTMLGGVMQRQFLKFRPMRGRAGKRNSCPRKLSFARQKFVHPTGLLR